jgi:hypothetical protein
MIDSFAIDLEVAANRAGVRLFFQPDRFGLNAADKKEHSNSSFFRYLMIPEKKE